MTTRSDWLGVYAGLQSVPLMTSRHMPPLQAPRRAHVEAAGPHEEPPADMDEPPFQEEAFRVVITSVVKASA